MCEVIYVKFCYVKFACHHNISFLPENSYIQGRGEAEMTKGALIKIQFDKMKFKTNKKNSA